MSIHIHLFVDPNAKDPLVEEAVAKLAAAPTALVDVGGFKFSQDLFGIHACWWNPEVPLQLRGLPITEVRVEKEVDIPLALGYHERPNANAWVLSATGWEENPVTRRKIELTGRDIDSVFTLFREILQGEAPTPVLKPEPPEQEASEA